MADGSRPFHVHCDAAIDGYGAAVEQEQPEVQDGPSRTSAALPSILNSN